MKKAHVTCLMLVLMFFTVIGCSDSKSAQNANSGAIELTLWDLRTETVNGEMIDSIIAEFEKANPNITVKRSAF
ncbi:MAG: hypothetical protein R3Y36_04630, partial [Spirochaetales bacterium]